MEPIELGCCRNGTAENGSVPCPFRFCVVMHNYAFPKSHVRPFDIALLVPNVLFLAYLFLNIRPTIKKLAGSLALFKILYVVTFFIPFTGIIYAVISMTISRDTPAPKVFNVICRSSVLLTELNVILFGVFFKFYKNLFLLRLAITVVIIVVASLVNASIQLTFVFIPYNGHSNCELTSPYGYLYSSVLSIIFALLYCTIFILYLTKLYARWDLPSKKSFYRYTFFLMCLNLLQAVGSMLLFVDDIDNDSQKPGLCITTIATFLYYTSVAPVVYWIFLRNYFRMNILTSSPPGLPRSSSADDINISRGSSFNKGVPIHRGSSIATRGQGSINNIQSIMRTDSKANAKTYCQEQAALLSEDGSSNSSFGSVDEEEGVKMNIKVPT